MTTTEKRKTSEIVFREDLYPRIKHDPSTVQSYAEDLEPLPPIEINQRNELIDGWHRWTAYKTNNLEEIPVKVTQTSSDVEFLALAIQRNAAHGLRLNDKDKKREAVRLYQAGTGLAKDRIASVLSVSQKSISRYLEDIDRDLREQRKEKIMEMWMACYSEQEISDNTGVSQANINGQIKELSDLDKCPILIKHSALFQDEKFTPPIFNVWKFNSCSNEVTHFGKSEQTILENLLYLYTSPFDIVVDPFGGGGSTIDVAKKRMRRYWVSDRKPIEARKHEIRQLDIIKDGVPPLHNRWSEVSLTYLDPPYWWQAKGQYSDDKEDLGNQTLEQFTENLIKLVNTITAKQSKGAVAMLMQPTQWNAPGKRWTDHIVDIVSGVKTGKFQLENRVSCPYSSEQANVQMVNYAKEHKMLLGISRELIIWKVPEDVGKD